MFPSFRFNATGQKSPKTGLPAYALAESMVYFDREFGPITVPQGFVTDFISFPKFRQAFGKEGAASAIVHDYAYEQLVPKDIMFREQADSMFLRAMKKEKVPLLLRYSMYTTVRLNTIKMRIKNYF
jgi:hypothetical protein